MGGSGGYGWPGGWSQDRNEQVRHYRHWSFVGINAIAKAVAGLTPNVALVRAGDEAADDGHRSRALLHRYQKTLTAIKPHEIITPVRHNHPLLRLLRKPNAVDVAWDLWFELLLFLELTGNSYLWVVPNRMGLPCELWVIPAQWVWPHAGTNELVDYYEVRPMIGTAPLKIPPRDMIHFRWKNPLHKLDGHSSQQAISEWIDAAESVNTSRFFQFKNGCMATGSIELGENYNDPDDAELDRIYAKFFARLQGEQNVGRPIIMPPGAKYTPLTIAPQEMAYVESADQLRDWVLAALGVPKEIVGIQSAGAEIAMYGPINQFFTQCIIPKLQYLGQVLTERLASRWDADLRTWWDDPTPPSPTQVNQDLETDFKWGIRTPNEGRALRGLEPYRFGGDDPLLPVGTAPMPMGTGLVSFDAPPISSSNTPPLRMAMRTPRKRLRKAQAADGTELLDVPDVRQGDSYSCGAACLWAVCQYFGVGPETEEEFIDLLGTNPVDGTAPEQLLDLAGELSLGTGTIENDAADFVGLAAALKAGHPVICDAQADDSGDSGHYVVAIGLSKASVYVMDPLAGRKRIGRKRFAARWHDGAYQGYGIALGKPAAAQELSLAHGRLTW